MWSLRKALSVCGRAKPDSRIRSGRLAQRLMDCQPGVKIASPVDTDSIVSGVKVAGHGYCSCSMTTGLTPALVVVDSRNIFHQTASATGYRERPVVDGVIDAMHDYGFEALEVHVGLALPRARDAVTLSEAKRVNELFRDSIEANPQGKVLLGELHLKQKARGQVVAEEKQVDVACAVDICRHANLIARHESRFKAIVVLSQDTDLSPALRYAQEIHVPVIVGAHERVEYRGFPHLLLTERSFRKIAGISAPLIGHALRHAVATSVIGPDRWGDWELVAWDATRERWLVKDANGLLGVLRSDHASLTGKPSPGDVLRLRVAGADFGRRGNDFPLVTCTPKGVHPGHDHRTRYERRVVAGRRGINEVILDRPVHAKSRLDYPPGGVLAGAELLIDCGEPLRPVVVGPLELPTNRDLCQACPFSVTTIQQTSPTTTAATSRTHGRVVISHSAGTPPELGVRYAAVLVNEKRVAKLISSVLP